MPRRDYKAYYAEHREDICKRQRDWNRKHRLSTGTGRIKVEKRDYPEGALCELCGREAKLLSYHHWDDEVPEFGLWLCTICHKIAEALEVGVADKYNQLKQEVSREVALEKVSSLMQILEAK